MEGENSRLINAKIKETFKLNLSGVNTNASSTKCTTKTSRRSNMKRITSRLQKVSSDNSNPDQQINELNAEEELDVRKRIVI